MSLCYFRLIFWKIAWSQYSFKFLNDSKIVSIGLRNNWVMQKRILTFKNVPWKLSKTWIFPRIFCLWFKSSIHYLRPIGPSTSSNKCGYIQISIKVYGNLWGIIIEVGPLISKFSKMQIQACNWRIRELHVSRRGSDSFPHSNICSNLSITQELFIDLFENLNTHNKLIVPFLADGIDSILHA